MTPVRRALWFMDARAREAFSLDDVATFAGVTPQHLAQAFMRVTGSSVMSYARRRRLSLAALTLTTSNADILTIALDHGYNSHEAFTRAMKSEFNVTPSELRTLKSIDTLELQEPFAMPQAQTSNLSVPRLEKLGELVVMGLSTRMRPGSTTSGAELWQRFALHMGHLPGQVPGFVSYGVCSDFTQDRSFLYTAAMPVKSKTTPPDGMTQLVLAPQTYAVVFVNDHISNVGAAWTAVFEHALPNAGHHVAAAPSFERYDERFDPQTGLGGYEIWIPIEA
jgi:AraC family transcriptional regulator